MSRDYNVKLEELRKKLEDTEREDSPDAAKIEAIEKEVRSTLSAINTRAMFNDFQASQKKNEPIVAPPPPEPVVDQRAQITRVESEGSGIDSERYRSALVNYLRNGGSYELRDITAGKTTGGDTGGYLIPEAWATSIFDYALHTYIMRKLSTVEQASLNTHYITITNPGESFLMNRCEPFQKSDIEFGEKILRYYWIGREVDVCRDVLLDANYNVADIITREIARSNSKKEEDLFINGDGVNKPSGFLKDSLQGATGAPNYQSLMTLWTALPQMYQANSSWVMSKATLATLLVEKDGSGRYIYSPPLSLTDAPTLLGRPVYLSDFMPSGAGTKSVAYGDFKQFLILDRFGFLIRRLDEVRARENFVVFLGQHAVDSILKTPQAIYHLLQA